VSVPRLSGEELTAANVGRALRESGGFLVHPSFDADLCARAVAAAHEFFALPRALKQATAIERSRHFRGWSELHNERDWREQIHLGRERAAAGDVPAFNRLEGPNLWPPSAAWRAVLTAYLDAISALGERLLACVAADLGLPASPFAGVGRDGYVLLKLIGYHPQPSAQERRPGVAAHVDFSWLTLTLQDSAGLEVMSPGGGWMQVEALPGALWVHPGELLQVASGGAFTATPHRVLNPSLDRTRVSLPFFLNPPLTGQVQPLVPPTSVASPTEAAHIHRVFPPGAATGAFHFGEAEWLRKGRNGWCHACSPPRAEPRE
jgi:isopenicillin N synthase-like dioxygenase